MDNFEKLLVYIPLEIKEKLDSDARLFEIFKSDGETINRNRFINLLILGYYSDYASEVKNNTDKIKEEIQSLDLSEDISLSLTSKLMDRLFYPEITKQKGIHLERLAIKPTKDTIAIITDAENNLNSNESLSWHFCKMIMDYCKKPITQRERIIFKNNYELLSLACKNKRPVLFTTIWNKNVSHRVLPYKIIVGSDELFNYLYCQEVNPLTNLPETRVYRLNRITGICNIAKINQESFDMDVLKHLILMEKYKSIFAINNDETACIKLSSQGELSFRRMYYGRPEYYKKESNKDYSLYYFDCSIEQLYLYFRRFESNNSTVIYPESLKNKIIKFHEDSLKNYK